MDSLPNNTGPTKELKSNYLSNCDIQKIYLNNEFNEDSNWMYNLYSKVSFLSISRMKKIKFFSNREDLEQSIRMAIWEAINSFDPHKNFDFYRWITWQINKAVRDYQKAESRFFSINLYNDCTSNAIFLEERDFLWMEIFGDKAVLSNKEKRIVFQYYIEGFTLSEIGLEEGLSPEGVRKVCQKSVIKLRKMFN